MEGCPGGPRRTPEVSGGRLGTSGMARINLDKRLRIEFRGPESGLGPRGYNHRPENNAKIVAGINSNVKASQGGIPLVLGYS